MTKVILLGSGYIIAQLFPQQHNWREYLLSALVIVPHNHVDNVCTGLQMAPFHISELVGSGVGLLMNSTHCTESCTSPGIGWSSLTNPPLNPQAQVWVHLQHVQMH